MKRPSLFVCHLASCQEATTCVSPDRVRQSAFPVHVCLSWPRGSQGRPVCLDSVHASTLPQREKAGSLRDCSGLGEPLVKLIGQESNTTSHGHTNKNNDKNSHNKSTNNNINKDRELRRKRLNKLKKYNDNRTDNQLNGNEKRKRELTGRKQEDKGGRPQ